MDLVSRNQVTPNLSISSCSVYEVFSRECPLNIECGLHARPIVMLMKLAKHFVRSEDGERVEFTVNDHAVNPRQGIIAMLGLVGGKGSVLGVTVRCAEAERAKGLLDSVQALVCHTCPEEAIHRPDAAEKIGLKPELVDVLRCSIRSLTPE